MPEVLLNTLSKKERICSKTQIDRLFNKENSRSLTAFPIRAVYMLSKEEAEAPVQMLVSVPKRCFHRAVKRNRVKRQIREAYRKHKHALIDRVEKMECGSLMVAFIWLDGKLYDSEVVEQKVIGILNRIEERIG